MDNADCEQISRDQLDLADVTISDGSVSVDAAGIVSITVRWLEPSDQWRSISVQSRG